MEGFRSIMMAADRCREMLAGAVGAGRVENDACWAQAALIDNGTRGTYGHLRARSHSLTPPLCTHRALDSSTL